MPRNVKVYHSTKQPRNRVNPCQINNGGCEHFCLLSHLESTSSSVNGTGNTFRCKCKIGYELRRDLKTCERVYNSLYFSQTNAIRGIALEQ